MFWEGHRLGNPWPVPFTSTPCLAEWKGLNFHYGQCYQANVPPTLPSPPLGGHAPDIHFPKQNFKVTESQGSKLQTGRAGQAIWCLNHYLHHTSNPGLLPDQILKRLPRLISAQLVLFGAKSSLSLAWPFDQKSGRGGGGETAVYREPSGIMHVAQNLRGWATLCVARNCAGARQGVRLTDQQHLRFRGACGTVSYPGCVRDPLLPSLTVGQGHPP